MTNVLFVNHWHDDNKGDSAITLATLDLIAPKNGERVRLASMLPSSDKAFDTAFRHVGSSRPDVTVEASLVPSCGSRSDLATCLVWILRWMPILAAMGMGVVPGGVRRRLAGVDRVILIGGSNVFDSGRRRPLGALRLLQVLYPAWAADRLGIPVDLFGHTLGPFRTRLSRAIARRILRKARFIVLREESSLSVAVELDRDLASRCRVEPDMAFAVRRPTPEQVVTVMARYGLIRSRYLVLVPRAHPYGSAAQTDRVLAEMARAGRATLSAGLVDVVVVLSQCLGPTTIEDDRPVAARLANLLPADSRLLIEDDLSVTELVGLLGGAAAVLSVRLHGAILAMSAGTPAHAIAYFTGKTAGVLAQCGMSNRWSEFADFTAECVTNLADIKERAAVALVAERERGRLDRLAGELAQ